MSREFSAAVGARGGRVLVREDFAHPFMDRDETVRRARSAAIRQFISQ
jgi:hypothetical protein